MTSDRGVADVMAAVIRHRLREHPGKACQTPVALQRRKRWYTVIHSPQFSKTSRHGVPVRSRQRTPFTMVRLSKDGRLFQPRSAGSTSLNSRQFRLAQTASAQGPLLPKTNP